MKVSVFIVGTCFFCISCNSDTAKSQSNAKPIVKQDTVRTNDKLNPSEKDTIIVNDTVNTIVGYEPSDPEYNGMNPEDKASMDEIMSDFNASFEEASTELKKNDIQLLITASPYIRVGEKVFKKNELGDDVGFLFISSKKKPYILKGAYSSDDLLNEAKAYFNY